MLQNREKCKILILDPSVIGESHSHHFQALIGYTTVLGKTGHTILTGTNTGCKYRFEETINYPTFGYSIYDDFINRKTGRFNRLLNSSHYDSLLHDIVSSIRYIQARENLGSRDHVFIPTLDWLLYQALLEVFNDLQSSPSMHLLLMYERANWITGGYPYTKIIDSLKNEIDSRRNTFLYTETMRHGKQLENLLGVAVHSFPFPALPFNTMHEKKAESAIHIGALGGGRRDKGFCMLPQIIHKLSTYASEENLHFLIQAGRSEDKLDAQNRLLNRIDNVTLLPNEISRSQYEYNFMRCDLLIFPYDNNIYRLRGSGIVNEALANSIPLVCTRNTALEEAIICSNGICASGENGFAEAVMQIAGNLPAYRGAAGRARDSYVHGLFNNELISNINEIARSNISIQ